MQRSLKHVLAMTVVATPALFSGCANNPPAPHSSASVAMLLASNLKNPKTGEIDPNNALTAYAYMRQTDPAFRKSFQAAIEAAGVTWPDVEAAAQEAQKAQNTLAEKTAARDGFIQSAQNLSVSCTVGAKGSDGRVEVICDPQQVPVLTNVPGPTPLPAPTK